MVYAHTIGSRLSPDACEKMFSSFFLTASDAMLRDYLRQYWMNVTCSIQSGTMMARERFG